MKFNPYVYDTFKCFAYHKEIIVLDIDRVEVYVEDSDLLQLLFYELETIWAGSELKSTWAKLEGNQNIIKPELFKVLPRVRILCIESGYHHPFSILAFLSVIAQTSLEFVTIRARPSWTDQGPIFSELQTSPDFNNIKQQYKDKHFAFQIEDDRLHIYDTRVYSN